MGGVWLDFLCLLFVSSESYERLEIRKLALTYDEIRTMHIFRSWLNS